MTLHQSTSQGRINYCRVCHVILDHIPGVLRKVFINAVQEKCGGHVWDNTSRSGQWMISQEKWTARLCDKQKKMIADGKTSEWDPTLLFHALLYSSLGLFIEEVAGATLVKGNVINVRPQPQDLSSLQGRRIAVEVKLSRKVNCSFHDIDSVSSSIIKIKPPVRGLRNALSNRVFVCDPKWKEVDSLRMLRNTSFAHKNNDETSDKDLSDLITRVTSHLHALGVSKSDIDELKAAETEVIVDEEYAQLHQRWMQAIVDRVSQLEKHVDDLQQADDDSEAEREEIGRQLYELGQELNVLKESKQNHSYCIDELQLTQQHLASEIKGTLRSRGAAIEHTQHCHSVKVEHMEARMDSFESAEQDQSARMDGLEDVQQDQSAQLHELQYTVDEMSPVVSDLQRRVLEQSEQRGLAALSQSPPMNVTFIVNVPSDILRQQARPFSQRLLQSTLEQIDLSQPREQLALPAPPPSAPEALRIHSEASSDAHLSLSSSSTPVLPAASSVPTASSPGRSDIVAAAPSGPGTPLLPLIPNPVESKKVPLERMIDGKLRYDYVEDTSSGSVRYNCKVTFTFLGRSERTTSDYYGSRDVAKDSAIILAYDKVRSIISAREQCSTPRSTSSAGGSGAQFELKQEMKRKGLRAPEYKHTKSSELYSYQYQVVLPDCGLTIGDHCQNKVEAKESVARRVLEKLNDSAGGEEDVLPVEKTVSMGWKESL